VSLGPCDILFDEEAVDEYEDSNPDDSEQQCMDNFWRSVRRKGVDIPVKGLLDWRVLETCGFTIHIRHFDDGRPIVVERIYRNGIGRFRWI
jgi:hypothetical protein